MPAPRGIALIGQSGGPTCVINQSLVGLVEGCMESDAITHVYGALHGVQGILAEEFIDLGKERREDLERVGRTPCAALKSVRKKPTRDECEQILRVFQAHDIRYFFYIGGNDTAETAHLLNELAVEAKYDVRLFHVPKTIDNDLRVTDHCPGYGSAAKFVAQALMGDNLDNRSLPGVKVDVIMGRNAGWLTAASLLARVYEDDGPHLIYVPECVFDMESFLDDVEGVYAEHGRCVVAVSEGVHDGDGNLIAKSKETDVFGNAQLSGSGALGDLLAEKIRARMGQSTRVRADTFGYLQRAFIGVLSEPDALEALEVGREAVRVATAGEVQHGSLVILREGEGARYRALYDVTALENVARVTKELDARYLDGTNGISASFLSYLRPLVGELPRPGRLAEHKVPRQLS